MRRASNAQPASRRGELAASFDVRGSRELQENRAPRPSSTDMGAFVGDARVAQVNGGER